MNIAAQISSTDLDARMHEMGMRAKQALATLSLAPTKQKRDALRAMAAEIRSDTAAILKANESDLARGREKQLAANFLDRMMLDESRIDAVATGLEAMADLPDPVGRILSGWDRPNGFRIERVATPLGVIGVIFESRPNVTADAGGLCLMAGNAAILRSGSDALETSMAIHVCMQRGLSKTGLPEDAIQLVPVTDRAAVGAMLSGLGGAIDVIVPRGGRSLVERVETEARVPVFAHLEGICHIFVERHAGLDMAVDIAVNAKMRRTSICGAAECILVDRPIAETMVPALVAALDAAGCEVRGDAAVCALSEHAVAANDDDWGKEHLAAIISMAVVDDHDAAVAHIARYGSKHTDCIISEDTDAANRFLSEVDSAIVMHNISTQFADGYEFGMGGEIGIATGRMHARGPVGLEQLTSFKYRVHGSGQTRP